MLIHETVGLGTEFMSDDYDKEWTRILSLNKPFVNFAREMEFFSKNFKRVPKIFWEKNSKAGSEHNSPIKIRNFKD